MYVQLKNILKNKFYLICYQTLCVFDITVVFAVIIYKNKFKKSYKL
jgi:hypothetical protein